MISSLDNHKDSTDNLPAKDETVLANGYIACLACGPKAEPRYINTKIEEELIEFKAEISEKFSKSKMNSNFRFPRVASPSPVGNSYNAPHNRAAKRYPN
jgi:hypothetical protein